VNALSFKSTHAAHAAPCRNFRYHPHSGDRGRSAHQHKPDDREHKIGAPGDPAESHRAIDGDGHVGANFSQADHALGLERKPAEKAELAGNDAEQA
jgi:hypothetical protein